MNAELVIARCAFQEIASRCPALRMNEELDAPVELSFVVPAQAGLRYDVWLALQNLDELHFSVEHFWLEWFPCTEPERVEQYIDAVTGFLTGRFRILEHYCFGVCFKAQLQSPKSNRWETIGTWSNLLLVSARSRLSLLAPARDVKTLPSRIGGMVATRLRRLGIHEQLIRPELEAMNVAVVGRTRDRSVTGQMVDFAKVIPHYMAVGAARDDATLRLVEDKLGHTPCRSGGSYADTVWPDRDSARALALHWSEQKTEH